MMRKRFALSTKRTVPLLVITLAFVVTGAFLMLSRTIFGAPPGDIQHTDIGETIPMQGNGEVVIEDWAYNPHEQHMIATLHIDRSAVDRNTEMTFAAQDRSNARDELPVTMLYEDRDYVVIHIDAVPPSFDVIGMDIQEQETDDGIEPEESTNDNTPADLARIYADHRMVDVDESLTAEDETTYDQHVLSLEYDRLNDDQEDHQQVIENMDERIDQLEQELVDIEADILYSTDDEEVELESEHSQIESEIDGLETDMAQEQEALEVVQDEQDMIEEQMDIAIDE
ncbi:hypothetical protein HUG15_02365 [Salicibibacter cibarius]|uniref:Uncharacterized protein n=2 Tax=Salicibibacter TaxID=2685905 RepID=A0A514LJJ4_9BACI|nr:MULTISPECIES: hypothetical protein [Salicibibacter]QDI92024.1 hypothetical protein EPH95_13245 [Salicibibacter halophilus]QQK74559.1 hypothetical protein HUG15_02365 [Salicibibacter cibarius]